MRIIFMGTPRFAVVVLEALVEAGHQVLVVTQCDKAAGRDRRPRYSQVKLAALKYRLPVYQPERISSPAALEALGRFQPELIVVAAYGQILRASVLKLPPLGCLNVHPSLLPRYRGPTPIPAAIMAGETETGVTVIRMDEGMDTGDILAQRRLSIAADDTSESLGEKLARLGASLLLQTIPAWTCGEIVPMPQDHSLATYTSLIRKENGRIDWRGEAVDVERRCRAYHPWPGTYTIWQGRTLKVSSVQAVPEWRGGGEPGMVFLLGGQVGVVCGEGAVILKQVQLAGKKALSGLEFARGQRDLVGSVLGH